MNCSHRYQTTDTAGADRSDDRTTLKDVEREHIIRTLAATNWILGGPKGAGTRLGLARTTLIAKMQRLGIIRAQAWKLRIISTSACSLEVSEDISQSARDPDDPNHSRL